MNNRIKQTTIDNRSIQINLLKAGVGIAMSQKLGGLAATFFEKDGEGEMSIDFAKIFRGISSELKFEELDMMLRSLLSGIAIDNKGIDFDEEFAGNYGFLIKVVTFALQENFGSFFEGLDILGE
jgi:hypothetical protein